MTTSPSLVAPGRASRGHRHQPRRGHPRCARHDLQRRHRARAAGCRAKLKTLLAIVGPGLIVMVGDNDAGAFATYGQAGQNYGTQLLWTLLLLIPVLYVNQEMVLRLGAVTGVGHARLILERFGRFWGAFSVIDLFILNALTIVTEFIGITLAAGYLGAAEDLGARSPLAAVIVVAAAHRQLPPVRADRGRVLCRASPAARPGCFLVAPVRAAQMARGFVVPSLPGGSGQLARVMLLIIGDRRHHRRAVAAVLPAVLRGRQADHAALHPLRDSRPVHRHRGRRGRRGRADGRDRRRLRRDPRPRHFTDAAGIADGTRQHARHVRARCSRSRCSTPRMIGAAAVSLSTAYAIGDVLGLKHSLHRGSRQAKGFYAIYAALIAVAAAIVLIPDVPLGLITGASRRSPACCCQPRPCSCCCSATTRGARPVGQQPRHNVSTSVVISVLVALSAILTAWWCSPDRRQEIPPHRPRCMTRLSPAQLDPVPVAPGTGPGRRGPPRPGELADAAAQHVVQAGHVGRPQGTLTILGSYMAIAMILVIVRIIQLAISQ